MSQHGWLGRDCQVGAAIAHIEKVALYPMLGFEQRYEDLAVNKQLKGNCQNADSMGFDQRRFLEQNAMIVLSLQS